MVICNIIVSHSLMMAHMKVNRSVANTVPKAKFRLQHFRVIASLDFSHNAVGLSEKSRSFGRFCLLLHSYQIRKSFLSVSIKLT